MMLLLFSISHCVKSGRMRGEQDAHPSVGYKSTNCQTGNLSITLKQNSTPPPNQLQAKNDAAYDYAAHVLMLRDYRWGSLAHADFVVGVHVSPWRWIPPVTGRSGVALHPPLLYTNTDGSNIGCNPRAIPMRLDVG